MTSRSRAGPGVRGAIAALPQLLLAAAAVARALLPGGPVVPSVLDARARAVAATAAGETDEALAAWDEVATLSALTDDDLVESRLGQAEVLVGAGRCEDARRSWDPLLARYPLHPRVALDAASGELRCGVIEGAADRGLGAAVRALGRCDPDPVVALALVLAGSFSAGMPEVGERVVLTVAEGLPLPTASLTESLPAALADLASRGDLASSGVLVQATAAAWPTGAADRDRLARACLRAIRVAWPGSPGAPPPSEDADACAALAGALGPVVPGVDLGGALGCGAAPPGR